MPKRILSAATTAANRVRARLWRLAQKAEGPEFNLKMKLTMRESRRKNRGKPVYRAEEQWEALRARKRRNQADFRARIQDHIRRHKKQKNQEQMTSSHSVGELQASNKRIEPNTDSDNNSDNDSDNNSDNDSDNDYRPKKVICKDTSKRKRYFSAAEVLEMVTTRPKRQKYTCPSCAKSVYNLNDHNRRIHKSVKKVRTSMLDILEARRARGIKRVRRYKACPVCGELVVRLDTHLKARKHQHLTQAERSYYLKMTANPTATTDSPGETPEGSSLSVAIPSTRLTAEGSPPSEETPEASSLSVAIPSTRLTAEGSPPSEDQETQLGPVVTDDVRRPTVQTIQTVLAQSESSSSVMKPVTRMKDSTEVEKCDRVLRDSKILRRKVSNIVETAKNVKVSYRRKKRQCPLCQKCVTSLPRHLRNLHDMTWEETLSFRGYFQGDPEEKRRRSTNMKSSYKRPFCICLLCGCCVTRMDKHLQNVHSLKSGTDKYNSARKAAKRLKKGEHFEVPYQFYVCERMKILQTGQVSPDKSTLNKSNQVKQPPPPCSSSCDQSVVKKTGVLPVKRSRKKQVCLFCKKHVFNIVIHLKSMHSLTQEEAVMCKKCIQNDPEERRRPNTKYKRPFKMCPLCGAYITRLDKHLSLFHKLSPNMNLYCMLLQNRQFLKARKEAEKQNQPQPVENDVAHHDLHEEDAELKKMLERSTLKPEIKKCIGDIMHPFSTWLHTKHSQDRAGKFVQVLMDVMNFLQDLSKQHPEWNPEKLQSTPVLVDSLQKSMTTNHQAERTRDQLGSLLQLMDFLRGEKLKTSFVDARGQKASLRGLANVTSNKPVTSAAEDAQPKSNSDDWSVSEDEEGSDPISNLNEITEKLLLCKQWPSMLLAAKCDYQIGALDSIYAAASRTAESVLIDDAVAAVMGVPQVKEAYLEPHQKVRLVEIAMAKLGNAFVPDSIEEP